MPPSSLSQHEICVLKALDEQAFKPGIASAHAIRQCLTAQGLDKREVVDDGGLFYMAYRHTNKLKT